MRFILDFIYLFVAVAYSPVVIYRAIRHKRYRSGWGQRFGKITRKDPAKKCIWLHAVSMGEVNAARTVVEELENRFSHFEIVISTTTDTGFARASNIFGNHHRVFYFPLDFSWVMRRAFRRIRPAMCILMEQEVWPNFVQIAQRSNIPVVVVNGRISDQAFAKLKRVRPIAKKIFGQVTLLMAQSDEYARRFVQIGCPEERVMVTGSLKYDTAEITDKVEGADELAAQLSMGNERLWVAGATGPGEEKIILEVFGVLKQQKKLKDLRLVVVPRKPERFDEVAQIIANAGFDFIRYSSVKTSSTKYPDKMPVILGDTMGELRKFYSLATIIFVGRSLVPMGGSDMMEATALGKCTIFGPYAFNFKQTVDALLADNGAIMVKDKEQLLATMQKCLLEPAYADKIAQNGREVIRKNKGATEKTIEQIARFL